MIPPINPLVVILRPRDILEVIQSLRGITEYDVLWVNYFPKAEAWAIARKFIKSQSEEYTHLMIILDDLVAGPEHVAALVRDLEEHPEIQVISGVCNVDITEKGQQLAAVCNEIPHKDRGLRRYHWIPWSDLPAEGIHAIPHSGYAIMTIARDLIVNNIVTLEGDLDAFPDYNPADGNATPVIGDPGGITMTMMDSLLQCCYDVVLSHQLEDAGIKAYVDFGLRLKHLKVESGGHQHLLVGIRQPFTKFVPKSK